MGYHRDSCAESVLSVSLYLRFTATVNLFLFTAQSLKMPKKTISNWGLNSPLKSSCFLVLCRLRSLNLSG